jgi:GMP synthase-like glutamine amidotransferase
MYHGSASRRVAKRITRSTPAHTTTKEIQADTKRRLVGVLGHTEFTHAILVVYAHAYTTITTHISRQMRGCTKWWS